MMVDLEVPIIKMEIDITSEDILFHTYFQDKFICKIKKYYNSSPIINPITKEFFSNSAECFIRTIDGYLINHTNQKKKKNILNSLDNRKQRIAIKEGL
jgi:hypothetical protein